MYKIWDFEFLYLKTNLSFQSKLSYILSYFNSIFSHWEISEFFFNIYKRTLIQSHIGVKNATTFTTCWKLQIVNKKLNTSCPTPLQPLLQMQWWFLLLSEIFSFWVLRTATIKRKLPSWDYELKLWILHMEYICFQRSYSFM